MTEPSKIQGPESHIRSLKSEVQNSSLSSDSCFSTPDSGLPSSFPDTQRPAPNAQSWWCVSVPAPFEAAEAVANFLVELGSAGVIEGERDLTKPAATVTIVQGFFSLSRSRDELNAALTVYLKELQELFPSLGYLEPHFSIIRSDAWAEQWRGHFPPLPIGQRFLVLPPWESPSVTPERIAFVIDPSLAFGTGHHATTQGCLEAIEILCLQYGPPPRALDLGTGSGILAIALAKLGTSEVWATDNDPIALEEARKNAITNQVMQHIHLRGAEVESLPLPFPLLVANLFSSTLVSLAPTLTAAVSSDGHAILSGIQLDQEADVLAAYPTSMWRLVTRYPKDEWVTLVLQRA